MAAELVVVNGSSAGMRHDLTRGDFFIGRSPSSKIVINEPEVGWRHCQIRQHGDRFLVTDLRSSIGTYVNGIRSAERWLADRDQIGVGRTILMFRSGEEAKEERLSAIAADVKPVLLASCSLVFLFRALAANSANGQSKLLQNQILRLVSDLIPVEAGYLVLGSNLQALVAQYQSEWPDAGESGKA